MKDVSVYSNFCTDETTIIGYDYEFLKQELTEYFENIYNFKMFLYQEMGPWNKRKTEDESNLMRAYSLPIHNTIRCGRNKLSEDLLSFNTLYKRILNELKQDQAVQYFILLYGSM